MTRKLAAALYILTVVIVGTITFYPSQQAQAVPPRDLKFYKKGTSQAKLYKEMRLVGKGLGVKCNHCHVMTPRRQFAKNTKRKTSALQQMFLTKNINEKIKKFFPKATVQVTCYTCHRAKKHPIHKPVEDDETPLDMSKEKLANKFEDLTKWINKDIAKTFPKQKVTVTCYTCHRGEKKPLNSEPEDEDDDDE
jgi:hypothetical protein